MALEFIEVPFGGDRYADLLQLRREILRLPLGLDFTEADVATESHDFHLAVCEGPQLIACVLLHPVDVRTIKLRQMAVAATAQGRGIGAQLLRHAEQFAATRGYREMEMHARQSARAFYEKSGYCAEGAEFLEVTIPHVKMRKQLAAP